MGIRDLFGGKGGKIARLSKTVTNAYAQSGDRYAAMESLLSDGSEDAYVGLLKRFTITSTKSIEDEEEKGWVYRRLGMVGKPLLAALRRFCLEHDNIAWALRLVEDVANERDEWEILDALLAHHPPGYERDPAKKIQLLAHVADIDDPRVVDALLPYLQDPDETVRYAVVESLIDIADERARVPFLERLCHPEEDSLRLRTRILDGLASTGWSVEEFRDAVVKRIGNDHELKGNGIRRR